MYKSCHTSYRLQFVPTRLVSDVLQWQSISNKKISGLHSNITCISKCISKIYKSFSTTNSCVMYLFFILQFMFLVFIVARSMHQQFTKCLQIKKAYNYYRKVKSWAAIFWNMHITISILMKHSIMIQIYNLRIDILSYPYASQIPTVCLCRVCAHKCMRMCVCLWGYVCVSHKWGQVS